MLIANTEGKSGSKLFICTKKTDKTEEIIKILPTFGTKFKLFQPTKTKPKTTIEIKNTNELILSTLFHNKFYRKLPNILKINSVFSYSIFGNDDKKLLPLCTDTLDQITTFINGRKLEKLTLNTNNFTYEVQELQTIGTIKNYNCSIKFNTTDSLNNTHKKKTNKKQSRNNTVGLLNKTHLNKKQKKNNTKKKKNKTKKKKNKKKIKIYLKKKNKKKLNKSFTYLIKKKSKFYDPILKINNNKNEFFIGKKK